VVLLFVGVDIVLPQQREQPLHLLVGIRQVAITEGVDLVQLGVEVRRQHNY
jgi:hypothetical protein